MKTVVLPLGYKAKAMSDYEEQQNAWQQVVT
jgi:hypothetical protein